MSNKICHQSASCLIESMKKRRLSAVEVMRAHLEQIEKLNPILNGLVQQFSKEECLKHAANADHKLSKGHVLGKLHGLPVTLKDVHLVKGLVSCAGSAGLKDQIAKEDSTIVSRLRKEGAIVVGITNVPEFLSAYETDNSVYGRTNNPYDLTKTAGGSSGGCAALIASGCIPLSIGSDAAGSIRWPAQCTGISAHKPTIGLVPRTGNVMGKARGLYAQFSTSGPMARYVEDLELVLPIISGPDGYDPHCFPVNLQDAKNTDTRTLRIAYILEDDISCWSDEITETLTRVVSELKKHVNSKVDCIQLGCLKNTYRLLWENFFLGGDGGESIRNALATMKVTTPSQLMQQFLIEAKKSQLSVAQFRNLFREIDLYRIQMLESLKDYDILLSPVAATVAKTHGTTLKESKDMTPCMVHSLTGWPVTTLRCGVSSSGLPINIQIAAKPWNDHLCMALGKKLQEFFGGWKPSRVEENLRNSH